MSNDNSTMICGADIGGSHITAAQVDPVSRQLTATPRRLKLDPHGSSEAIITSWSTAIREACDGCCPGRLGIAMPGPFDYERGISFIRHQGKYDALYKLDVRHLIADALSMPPDDIVFTNDAACFVLGETLGGAVQGFEKVVGLTLGTGLGSALYSNGAAENLDIWNTRFRDSIAEDYLSTRWFVQRHFEKTGAVVHGVKELADAFGQSEVVRDTFQEFSANLGILLQQVMKDISPQAIVIGGNISNAYTMFAGALKTTMQRFPYVKIERGVLGEDAAVIGAAMACTA